MEIFSYIFCSNWMTAFEELDFLDFERYEPLSFFTSYSVIEKFNRKTNHHRLNIFSDYTTSSVKYSKLSHLFCKF
jgi:hypothetical protein